MSNPYIPFRERTKQEPLSTNAAQVLAIHLWGKLITNDCHLSNSSLSFLLKLVQGKLAKNGYEYLSDRQESWLRDIYRTVTGKSFVIMPPEKAPIVPKREEANDVLDTILDLSDRVLALENQR